MSGKGLDERGLPPGYYFRADWEVTPRQVKEKLEADGLFLLDCRKEAEWERCHIDGATLIPVKELAQRTDDLAEMCGGKGREIVVYCHSGRRALWAALYLREAGFDKVKSMAGGIDLWAYDIDPTLERYPRSSTGKLAFEVV